MTKKINDGLTYEELKLPNYVNSSPAVTLRTLAGDGEKTIYLSLTDVIFAAEIAGLNMLLISDTGRGKTQLLSDIANRHFGGTADEGGANITRGRSEFEIKNLLEHTTVDLANGKYDSKAMTKVDVGRTGRLLFGVDEINRAPKPRQNDFFDFAEGSYNFEGQDIALGREGYALFIATANLNRSNGDFSGTFELDRALLNRAHLTIDLDHKGFRPTHEDMVRLEQRKVHPRRDTAEKQDLSAKILNEYKQLKQSAGQLDPYMLAFRFLITEGLSYCARDRENDKYGVFPMLCNECEHTTPEKGKGTKEQKPKEPICSMIKDSTERTVSAVKLLAHAFSRIAQLKTGEDIKISPLDAALQAFKFTTYHGNLNDIVANQEYAGRKQVMMSVLVEKLTAAVELLKEYIPLIKDGKAPALVSFTDDGEIISAPPMPELVEGLKEKGIAYTERNLKTDLAALGLGSDWVDAYVGFVKDGK